MAEYYVPSRWFWNIVEKSRENIDFTDPFFDSLHSESVKKLLRKLSADEILEYQQNYLYADYQLDREEVYEVFSHGVVEEGCSDSFWRDHIGWLISRGEKEFQEVLQSPINYYSSLFEKRDVAGLFSEAFASAAVGVFLEAGYDVELMDDKLVIPGQYEGSDFPSSDFESLDKKMREHDGLTLEDLIIRRNREKRTS